ncbi:MAG: hypothetical protein QM811_08240 [Pirellulales bacterium]
MESQNPELPARTQRLVVSYHTLRRAIGLSGFFLPVALGLGGLAIGVPIQDNMSGYYHTPLRDVFVGTLFAIGVFLLCYRGYDWIENWTANIGCVSALLLALCPLDPGSDPLEQRSLVGYLHTIAGGVFFSTLAFYSLYHFPRSSRDDAEREPHPWERNAIYRGSGIIILTAMLTMGAYLVLFPPRWKEIANDWNFLFFMESLATWAFAAAWLTKGLRHRRRHRGRTVIVPPRSPPAETALRGEDGRVGGGIAA